MTFADTAKNQCEFAGKILSRHDVPEEKIACVQAMIIDGYYEAARMARTARIFNEMLDEELAVQAKDFGAKRVAKLLEEMAKPDEYLDEFLKYFPNVNFEDVDYIAGDKNG